jgi:tetratricopeptide (TPR) repeat protein
MRKLIPLMFIVALPINGPAQPTDNAAADWSGIVEGMESAAAGGDSETLARLASDLAELELDPIQWRHYWSAFAAYRQGLFSDDDSIAESAYKHCAEATETAIELGERSGESEALRGACYGQLAGTGPMAGMRYGSRSGVAVDTALTDDPDNPRALMIAGARDLYTPTQWGGDIERAIRRLERAIERYESTHQAARATPWQPRWGRMDAFGHLAIAYRRLERVDEAREVLARAETSGIESGWLDSIGKGLDESGD